MRRRTSIPPTSFRRTSSDLRTEVYYPSPWRGGWWRLGDAVRYMIGASMAVLDTAAKNREDLLYDRYRAGRDVIARFTKDPPYAYIIPREQRDTPTAQLLVEKMMTDGIEIHQATRDGTAGGATYKEGDWMILMDQPFAALVKELFDVQKYPQIPHPPAIGETAAGGRGAGGGGRGAAGAAAPATPAATPATTAAAAPAAAAGGGRGAGGGGRGAAGGGRGAAGGAAAGGQPPTGQVPYDVTGWTLPMQMGVEVIAVAQPVSAESRATLRKLERIDPIVGKVEGTGPVFAFSHQSNASLKAVSDILAAGGTVKFGKTGETIYATGKVEPVLQKDGVNATSVKEAPDSWPISKPRIAVYDSWTGNIDEGWTRWIMEQNHFPFTLLHNADVQAGHLREQFDVIVVAEMGTRQIMDGMAPGTVPGQYAGGIGETGANELRDFVTEGGTLVTFGNATLFAMDEFNLAVTNVVAGLRQDQFFCSGSLLRTEIKDAAHPVVAGLPLTLPVMFERNPVFDTKPAFRGKVLLSYVKDRNPLAQRLSAGRGADSRQGRRAGRQLWEGPHHHAGLPAAVARPIARHLQVLLQCAVLQRVDGAPDAGRRRGARRQGRRRAERVETRSRECEDGAFAAGGSEPRLLHGARSGGGGRRQEAGDGAGYVSARPPAGAGGPARAGGRCRHCARGSHVHRAASQVRDGLADQGFQRVEAGRSAGPIQTGGGAMKKFAVSLLFAATAWAQLPTPESVLGHKPGDDFYLATYEDSLGYFRKLAAASDRIKLVNVGKTTQGRDWWMAFISAPENLAQLEHYKDISRRLAVARGISDEQAHALAHEIKPIIHIDGGLHASEVANHQHTIQLGYDLVAREEPLYQEIRKNLIVELWFSINPDGQTIVADWYRQNLGTPYEVSPLPVLWQEYVGHDNNRDGYMLNMLESREVTKATLETQPLVFYTQHQIGAVSGPDLSAAVRRPDQREHAPADAAVAEPDRHEHRAVPGRSQSAGLDAPGDVRRVVSGLPG